MTDEKKPKRVNKTPSDLKALAALDRLLSGFPVGEALSLLHMTIRRFECREKAAYAGHERGAHAAHTGVAIQGADRGARAYPDTVAGNGVSL